jgi:hypothetical protein
VPLLYYWRGDNYRRDLDFGAGYHLNQANPLLHEIGIADSVWAFTRKQNGIYALAAELIVSAKTLNPRGYRYGRYRVWGHLRESKYFAVDEQPDITSLIRSLSIHSRGDVLGRAFQGHAAVRRITLEDHKLLAAYATRLPLEKRARLIPEERLEALLLSGDEAAVEQLIQEEPSGLIEERRHYLEYVAASRNRQLADQLQDMYSGRCQLCGWEPRKRYEIELCEAHHVRWLSRGGEDSLQNLVLICPNHHRAIHRCDAPFDWEQYAFVFASHLEPLTIRDHALMPS